MFPFVTDQNWLEQHWYGVERRERRLRATMIAATGWRTLLVTMGAVALNHLGLMILG